MGLLPDTGNCWLRMRREWQEHFTRHRLQRKPIVSNPGMHYGTCVTHVPWCMSGSLTLGSGENVPGIPGACATRNCIHLSRGPSSTNHMQWFLKYIFVVGTGGSAVHILCYEYAVLFEKKQYLWSLYITYIFIGCVYLCQCVNLKGRKLKRSRQVMECM